MGFAFAVLWIIAYWLQLEIWLLDEQEFLCFEDEKSDYFQGKSASRVKLNKP